MAFVPNSGSVLAFQGTVPWSVLGTVVTSGSVVAVPTGNQSVSGTVGASLIGLSPINVTNFPTNQNVSGSVVSFQGTNPWVITGSVQASLIPAANQSVSGTVGASIIGLTPVSVSNFPTTQNVSGSVVAFQGTVPWTVNTAGSIAAVIVGGSIAASFTPPANQSVSGVVNVGSVLSIQGYVSTSNSISSQLSTGSIFTGVGEEVKDFSAIYVTVFTDKDSATDGLSLQRSSNNTNWDITDTYTVPSLVGKTYQIQPDARFFRIQYANSAANQGVMRLQTVYKQSYSKPSSQRPSDNYTNETDLEQMQAFNMVLNPQGTWDRSRGDATNGLKVYGSIQGFPTTQNVSGSVVAFQGTNPWNIAGSVAAFQAGTQITSISGNLVVSSASIAGQVTVVSSLVGGIFPISGSVAAVVTNVVNVNTAGSVVAFQGTSPWVVNFQNSSIFAVPVGSVGAAIIGGSILGTYAEDTTHADANKGLFTLGVRNDTIASFVGTNLDYTPYGVDSAGRFLTKPFAPEESRIEGYNSVASSSVMALIPAAGAGLRNYVTDFFVVNTGATTALVTWRGAAGSILGYTIAPSGGGSNATNIATPIRTPANDGLEATTIPASSVIYITVKGFKAP